MAFEEVLAIIIFGSWPFVLIGVFCNAIIKGRARAIEAARLKRPGEPDDTTVSAILVAVAWPVVATVSFGILSVVVVAAVVFSPFAGIYYGLKYLIYKKYPIN